MRRRVLCSAGRLCSAPNTPKIPHMSHAHWLRVCAAGVVGAARAADGAQRHSQPSDVVEVEVVRHWMKKTCDHKGIEADLCAVGEIVEFKRGSIAKTDTAQDVQPPDASDKEHQKETQARES